MLKHIVMMKLKETSEKEQHQIKLVDMLQKLPQYIQVIEELEAGKNFSTRPTAMDVVLVVSLKDESALDEYRIHPEHVKVLNFIKQVVGEIKVVDYWV